MQYLSGVWESLTGQASAKRKRSGDESAALPVRMTSLKLSSDQCPGRQQSSATYSRLPEQNLLDSSSCATTGSYFRPPGSFSTSDDCFVSGPSFCQQVQDPTFRLPPPVQAHNQQQGSISNRAGSSVKFSSQSASTQPSYTDCSQHHHFVPHALKSTQHTFLQAQQHHSFTAAAHPATTFLASRLKSTAEQILINSSQQHLLLSLACSVSSLSPLKPAASHLRSVLMCKARTWT